LWGYIRKRGYVFGGITYRPRHFKKFISACPFAGSVVAVLWFVLLIINPHMPIGKV